MIHFISDTHFDHKKIIELANRPFTSCEEMNEHIIQEWNKRVRKGDIVFHLGDFAFTANKGGEERLEKLKRSLHGEIRLLIGNHDDRRLLEKVFGPIWMPRGLWRVRHAEERIVICHYALRTWEGQHYGAWHLFGHSHGSLEPFGRSVDVGVDAHFIDSSRVWGAPYSFEEIEAYMKDRNIAVPDRHQLASRR